MKATGIVRKIDVLGRIVIPKELRRTLRINEGDPLEIYTDDEGGIVLRKHEQVCVACGDTDIHVRVLGIKLCQKCLERIKGI